MGGQPTNFDYAELTKFLQKKVKFGDAKILPEFISILKSLEAAKYDFKYESNTVLVQAALTRVGIVRAAKMLGVLGHPLRARAQIVGNSTHWRNLTAKEIKDVKKRGGSLDVILTKQSGKSYHAISEILSKKAGNKPWIFFDCNAAYSIACHYGVAGALGERHFNAILPDLRIRGDNKADIAYLNSPLSLGRPQVARKGVLIPGDGVRFVNPNGIANYRNENAIYLGRDPKGQRIFYAHGLAELKNSIGTKGQIESVLNNKYTQPGKVGKAKLLDTPIFLEVANFKLSNMAVQTKQTTQTMAIALGFYVKK